MSKPKFNPKNGVTKTESKDALKTPEEKSTVDNAGVIEDTQKDPKENATSDNAGVTEDTQKDLEEKATTAEVKSKKSNVPEGMKEYFKVYPKEKTFFRTSDGQVFLEADKQWAVDHQKHIGGELETINRS